MDCVRCGMCCTVMDVPIRVGDRVKWKPGTGMCPHLSFEGTEAACAVHDEPWFSKETCPCHVYGNSEIDPDFFHKRGKPCPVGTRYQEEGGFLKVRPGFKKFTVDELEDLGTWCE